MSYDLLTVQQFRSQPADDTEYPVFSEGWQLKLAAKEQIVWQGSASALHCTRQVNGTWKNIGALNAKCQVTITNTRIVYICHQYKTGGMWFGGPIAIPLTLGGKGITALTRQGKAAVGQVRYQYPQAILAKSIKLGPITSNEVNLICKDNSGRFLIKLDLSIHEYETVAATLNQQIAVFRGIDPPKAETKEESKTTLIGYTFPSQA